MRYETVTRELPFETQTIEDAGLDFGKTETVQAGQNGSELVTSEITTVAGEVSQHPRRWMCSFGRPPCRRSSTAARG